MPDSRSLDAQVAEAMGWQGCHSTGGLPCGVPPGAVVCDDAYEAVPQFTTTGAGLLAMLEFAAGKGLYPTVFHFKDGVSIRWGARVGENSGVRVLGEGDTPGLALALALVSWSKSKGKGA